MKVLSKLMAVIVFGALMFGSVQTAETALIVSDPDSLPDPKPTHLPSLRAFKDFNLNPRPGFDVTLLMNQTVHFQWENKIITKFVIKDDKGKVVFTEDNVKQKSININLAELNLKTGKKYSWTVNDQSKEHTFTILDEEIEKQLTDNFAKIDAENISEQERTLKKATYVQQLSETYPKQFDLYWLSAQWMSTFSPADKEQLKEMNMILQRCVNHLNNERKHS